MSALVGQAGPGARTPMPSDLQLVDKSKMLIISPEAGESSEGGVS